MLPACNINAVIAREPKSFPTEQTRCDRLESFIRSIKRAQQKMLGHQLLEPDSSVQLCMEPIHPIPSLFDSCDSNFESQFESHNLSRCESENILFASLLPWFIKCAKLDLLALLCFLTRDQTLGLVATGHSTLCA